MTPELIATCAARHVCGSPTTAAASTSGCRCRYCASSNAGTVSLPLLMTSEPQPSSRSWPPAKDPACRHDQNAITTNKCCG
jgi:hypothetical protein